MRMCMDMCIANVPAQAITASFDGRIWVFGGRTGQRRYGDLHALEGGNFRKVAQAGMTPPPLEFHTLTAVRTPSRELLAIFGGRGGRDARAGHTLSDELYLFDVVHRRWLERLSHSATEVDCHPASREHHGAVACSGCVVVFGGHDGSACLGDLWVCSLDPAEEPTDGCSVHWWEPILSSGSPPSPRAHHTMGYAAGAVLVYGGRDDVGRELDEVFGAVLDDGTVRWQMLYRGALSPRAPPVYHVCGEQLLRFEAPSAAHAPLVTHTMPLSAVSVPEQPPAPRLAETPTDRSVSLTWAPGLAGLASLADELAPFELLMSPAIDESPCQSIYSGADTYFTIRGGLQPQCEYTFVLFERSTVGSSAPSAPLVVTTAPAMPAVLPPQVVVDSATSTSFGLRWEVDADATHYELLASRDGSGMLHSVYAGPKSCVDVKGLSANRAYTVKLQVHYLGHATVTSVDNVVYTTPEAPMQLRVLHVTNSYASLAWERSEGAPDGAASSAATVVVYELHLRKLKSQTAKGREPFRLVYSGAETKLQLPELRASTWYEVTVRARNMAGTSSFCEPQSFVTAKRGGQVKFQPIFAWAPSATSDHLVSGASAGALINEPPTAPPTSSRLRVRLDDGSWTGLSQSVSGQSVLRSQAKTIHGMFKPRHRPYSPARAHLEATVPPRTVTPRSFVRPRTPELTKYSLPTLRTPLLPRPQTTTGFRPKSPGASKLRPFSGSSSSTYQTT